MRHEQFPNDVVRHVESIEDVSYLYIVSEKMNKGDLASFMRNRRMPYLSESELQGPVRCITRALFSVHRLGFLHNDVQPCNIYLRRGKKSQGDAG